MATGLLHRELSARALRQLLVPLFVAGAALFSLQVTGADYGNNSYHAQQLPLLERLSDPAAYPGDYFVDTAPRLPSPLGRALAALPGGGRGGNLFFALQAVSRLALFAAFWYLSFSLSGSAAGAVLACFLLAISPQLQLASPLARDLLLRDHFDLTAAAAPFMIAGLAFWFRNERGFFLAALAGAALANPLAALLLLAAAAAAGLLELLYFGPGDYPRRLGPAALLAALAVPALLARAQDPALGGMLALWFPAHYFAGAWSGRHLAYAAACLLLAAGGLKAGGEVYGNGRRLGAFFFGLAGLWLAYYAVSLLWPGAALLAQLYRADALLWAVFLALLGPLAARTTAQNGTGAHLAVLAAVYAASAMPEPALLAAAGLALGVSSAPWFKAWAAETFYDLTVLLRAGLLLLTLAAAAKPWAGAALLRPFSGAVEVPRAEAAQLGAWAAAETEPGDVFLTPPGESLRLALRRPVVFEWTDGAAAHWSPGFAALWLERLRDLKVDVAETAAWWRSSDAAAYGEPARPPVAPAGLAFRSLGEDELAALAAKYGASYLVAYADMPPLKRRFSEVSAGSRFAVYRFNPKTGGEKVPVK